MLVRTILQLGYYLISLEREKLPMIYTGVHFRHSGDCQGPLQIQKEAFPVLGNKGSPQTVKMQFCP